VTPRDEELAPPDRRRTTPLEFGQPPTEAIFVDESRREIVAGCDAIGVGIDGSAVRPRIGPASLHRTLKSRACEIGANATSFDETARLPGNCNPPDTEPKLATQA
jgi:hypothetical protein